MQEISNDTDDSAVAWDEVASLVDCSQRDYFAVLYRAFIDDSADAKQEDIVTAGAIIGAHADWDPVREKWKSRLRKDGLSYFRSTEYYSLQGEFKVFRDPEKYPKPKGSEAAKALRDDLEAILQDAPVFGIGVAIPLKTYREYRETVPGADKVFGADAFYSALQSLMIECTDVVLHDAPVGDNGRENRIAFICDSTDRAPMYAEGYVDFKKRNPNLAQIMAGLVHLDDKKHPPLQAADMVASLSKELMLPCLTDVVQMKKPLILDSRERAPRLKGTFYKLVNWDWEWMERLHAAQTFGSFYSDTLMRSLGRR